MIIAASAAPELPIASMPSDNTKLWAKISAAPASYASSTGTAARFRSSSRSMPTTLPAERMPPAPVQPAGVMFLLVRNRFSGSHLAFTSRSRAIPAPSAASTRSALSSSVRKLM